MAATAPTATVVEEQYLYELVPLLPLPEVDLSISIKSHFIRKRRIHQLIRRVSRSPLTFVGYIASLGVAVAVFYVPARLGRALSVIVVLMGLPGALVSIGNLRFDMVAVMFKTYDTWFFGSVSTIVSVVLGLFLQDARALLMLTSWLSFVTNIFVDASVLGLRHIWFANIASVMGYVATATAITVGVTDDMKTFDLVRINGHALPAAAVVRDSIITMIIVIARNVVRKNIHALSQNKTSPTSTDFRCVSFRCRLQLSAVIHNVPTPGQPFSVHRARASAISPGAVTSRTKLRFKPDLQLIDVRNTMIPVRWLWRIHDEEISRQRKLLPWIGAMGFILTNSIYLLNIAWPELLRHPWHLPVIISAAGASTTFVGVTIAAAHRELLRAVTTSFDFLFIVVEITIVHVALADILWWQPTAVLALFSDLQWCMWILCWDAITPPVRKRLGLTRKFAAWIGPSLVAVLAFVVVVVFVVKPPNTIKDRVIYRFQLFDCPVEFRALTWYFSCAATISSWALRIMWRLWVASENELVVLDGTVVFENHARSRPTESKPTKRNIERARGQVATQSFPTSELPTFVNSPPSPAFTT